MSKNTNKTELTPKPLIKSMNPEAMNYLNWFMSDVNSLRNYAGQIFGGDVYLDNPKLAELKNSAELSLVELEDDIVKIREFLAAYVSTNNN